PHLDKLKGVSAILTLLPETLARPAPEMGDPRLYAQTQRFLVHIGEHQDLAGLGVTDNCRKQAIAVESWREDQAFFQIVCSAFRTVFRHLTSLSRVRHYIQETLAFQLQGPSRVDLIYSN